MKIFQKFVPSRDNINCGFQPGYYPAKNSGAPRLSFGLSKPGGELFKIRIFIFTKSLLHLVSKLSNVRTTKLLLVTELAVVFKILNNS